MDPWDRKDGKGYRAIRPQMEALAAIWRSEGTLPEGQTTLAGLIRSVETNLEGYLRQEERILFPLLEKVEWENPQEVSLFKQQNQQLHAAVWYLGKIRRDTEPPDLREIALVGDRLLHLLEDHERAQDRLFHHALQVQTAA